MCWLNCIEDVTEMSSITTFYGVNTSANYGIY
jgi:hypothetical protein